MTELRAREEIARCLKVLASAVLREDCGDWIFGDDVGALAQARAMTHALAWVLGHHNATFFGVLDKAEHGLGVNVPSLKGEELNDW